MNPFQTLIEASTVGMVVHRDSRLLYANKAAVEVFGRQDVAELFALESVFDVVHEDDVARMKSFHTARLRGEEVPAQYVVRCMRPDNGDIWIKNRPVVIDWEGEPAVLISLIDVSEQIRIEKAKAESEKRFHDFAAASADWFWEMDKELKFTFFSDRHSEITGLQPDRFLGKKRGDVNQGSMDTDVWLGHLDDLEARRPFRDLRYLLNLEDGRNLPVSISGRPFFDEDGNFCGYRGTGRDDSERSNFEKMLSEARDAALEASKSKSDFLAGTSHELRTPMNAIIGFSSLMMMDGYSVKDVADHQEYLKHIHDAGVHLLSIVNDVLDTARIEAGQTSVLPQDVDISFALGSSLALMSENCKRKQLEIVQDIPIDLPMVHVDARHVKQIFLNIIGNAVKFTPDRGTINISLAVENANLRIEIKDSGIGIPANEMEKVLKPFGQSGNDIVREQQGTGLGLPLSVSLIELNKGHFALESEEGTGTTVQIWLPLSSSD
jgi:PAS domain S-box-containing protein